jgi:hypothetical protein
MNFQRPVQDYVDYFKMYPPNTKEQPDYTIPL